MFVIISIINPIVRKIADILGNAGTEVIFVDPYLWEMDSANPYKDDDELTHHSNITELKEQINNADAVFIGIVTSTHTPPVPVGKMGLREQIFATLQQVKVRHLITLNYLNPIIAAMNSCDNDLYHGEDLNIIAEISAMHTTTDQHSAPDMQEFCMCMLTMYRPLAQQNMLVYQEILEDISLVIARELLYRGAHFNRRRIDFENGASYTQSLHCKVSRRIDRHNYRWRSVESHFCHVST
ncbi:hypothetical protein [Undibacterium flavidum]|uniref:Uncharacterized protein n=1 Tax=Undibacterium flavidum TaxID=2762297 RepID=A0ABR6Y898_9BURK|nr:hypothetical protein [Undibacterium flavidum]MBC3872869.1 hypothetical protein [Undibacterium flavidum]